MVVPDPHLPGGERAVLFDFGVAKFLSDRDPGALRSDSEPAAALSTGGREERTRTGVILGTPAYMAPEQCRGMEQQEPAIDAKVDVYALGVLLFRLCTGQLPFTGEMWELFTKHVTEPPPDPRTLNPDLDPRLAELLGRMLAKEPHERPDMAGVAEGLAGLFQSEPPVSAVGRAAAPPALEPGPAVDGVSPEGGLPLDRAGLPLLLSAPLLALAISAGFLAGSLAPRSVPAPRTQGVNPSLPQGLSVKEGGSEQLLRASERVRGGEQAPPVVIAPTSAPEPSSRKPALKPLKKEPPEVREVRVRARGRTRDAAPESAEPAAGIAVPLLASAPAAAAAPEVKAPSPPAPTAPTANTAGAAAACERRDFSLAAARAVASRDYWHAGVMACKGHLPDVYNEAARYLGADRIEELRRLCRLPADAYDCRGQLRAVGDPEHEAWRPAVRAALFAGDFERAQQLARMATERDAREGSWRLIGVKACERGLQPIARASLEHLPEDAQILVRSECRKRSVALAP